MEKNNIIGIIGVKRSGKDTIADYLIKYHGYTRYSFADPLKKAAMEIFGFSYRQMWGDDADKETQDPRWNISPRRALQLLGTELLQIDIQNHLNDGEFPFGRSIWVHKFKLWYLDEIKINKNLKVVISDVRFLHEEVVLNELGGTLCRVIRPELKSVDTHISEIEQQMIKEHKTIVNDGSLLDLYKKVEDTLIY